MLSVCEFFFVYGFCVGLCVCLCCWVVNMCVLLVLVYVYLYVYVDVLFLCLCYCFVGTFMLWVCVYVCVVGYKYPILTPLILLTSDNIISTFYPASYIAIHSWNNFPHSKTLFTMALANRLAMAILPP